MAGRYLSRTRGTETPSSIVFVDTNSTHKVDASNPLRRFASLRTFAATKIRLEREVVTRRADASGASSGEFWGWLATVSDDERCTWVFASSMHEHLTKLNFWELLDSKEFTLEPLLAKKPSKDGTTRASWIGKMCLEDRPFFIVCRRGNATYKFVDVANYWPDGLFGREGDSESTSNPTPLASSTDAEWIAFASARCNMIESRVIDLLQQWRYEQCGTFQLTAPMLAMSHFRHTCSVRTGKEDAVDVICMPGHKSHEMERASLHVGRVQPYFVGEKKEKIYHLDCNSLYPAMMRKYHFPRRFSHYQVKPSIPELRSIANCYGTSAVVKVHTHGEDFPVRHEGKTYYVTGRYWTTLSGPELARALRQDIVIECAGVQVYSVAPIFRRWIDYWYDRKIAGMVEGKGDRNEYEFAKLIMNSLGGKWAQRGRQWRDIPGKVPLVNWSAWPEYDYGTDKLEKWRGVGGNAQRLTDDGEPRHSFPLITSYICSYAREYMREVMAEIGTESVLYSATDSLILLASGYERLANLGYVHPTELGLFRLKGEYDYCRIDGSNQYQLGDKIVSSGLRGASLSQGLGGKTVDVSERIGTLIRRENASDIAIETIAVPPVRSDLKGKLNDSGRWEPFRLIDTIVGLGEILVPIDHRAY